MEQQTGPQLANNAKPLTNLSAKPTAVYQNEKQVFIPLNDLSMSIFDVQKSTFSVFGKDLHEKRINCLKEKNSVLITGSNDFTVRLWDRNSGKQIHKFLKPGAQFNCLDLSEHILCAAHTSKLVFWDLRKMKQRSQFNDSFNGQITSIQFDPLVPTVMMGCSVDGMINKFDLKEPNQQQAFMWCTKLIDSPSKMHFINNVSVVETTCHTLYLLEQEAVKNKIVVNNFDEPKHVLNSQLFQRNGKYDLEYWTWNLEKQLVEKWDNDRVSGWVSNVEDVEVFVPLGDKIMYIGEKGDVYLKNAEKEAIKNKNIKNLQQKQHSKPQQTSPKWQKIEQQQPANQNGFILNKPSSFKSKTKKFKPF